MKLGYLLLFLYYVTNCLGVKLLVANPDAKRLNDDLLSNDNCLIHPVTNVSDILTGRSGLKLSKLMEVNLKNQAMTTNLWMEQNWFDYKLQWNPDDYGGVEMLYVPSEHIWIPDGSYEVNLIHMDQLPGSSLVHVGIILSEFYSSVEWDIRKVPATRNEEYYTSCVEPCLDITFKLTVRKKTLSYLVNLIIPCVGLIFLTVLVFYLPSGSGEKGTRLSNIFYNGKTLRKINIVTI